MFDLVGRDDPRPSLVGHSNINFTLIIHQEPSFQEALIPFLDE